MTLRIACLTAVLALAAPAVTLTIPAIAQDMKMVGGARMSPSKTIQPSGAASQ
ncbi:hypothetical protein [Microvirga roseola]|uniref:hypothetical protein n=1 Tax=Microvirga roseola TaxID=2883126 RepID=UPI001E429CCE|nr:hypothetical protein [Microvirga roseola]